MRKYFLCAVFICMAISSVNCGKKGDDPVTGTTLIDTTVNITVDTSLVISFIPSDSPSDTTVTVFLEKVSNQDNQITLELRIKGGVNVFGAAVEINYDSSLISYVSASEGTYLNQGGNLTVFVPSLNDGQQGILLIGCDRQGTVQGADGAGVLANIIFKATSKQTNTLIEFNTINSSLYEPGIIDSTSQKIEGTSWMGGYLSYK